MAEMNTNTAELLQRMIDIKKDMRTAIGNKGVTVVSGMESYPSAIESIKTTIIEGDTKLPDGTKFSNSTFTAAPFFDTSAITDMSKMFDTCRSLTNVPQYNTSNVVNMSYMFSNCTSLSVIPRFDTSTVTDMYGMFRRSSYAVGGTGVAIEIIPLMDCGNVERFSPFDSYAYGKVSVNYVEGFKDLGKSITEDYLSAASYKNVSFERAILNHDSKVNIINNLYNIASQNKTLTLQMDVTGLSDDDIAIATNKGWAIQS